MLDLNDTSWVDQSMITEADDTVRVKVVDCRRSKPVVRHSNASHIDFDEEVGSIRNRSTLTHDNFSAACATC